MRIRYAKCAVAGLPMWHTSGLHTHSPLQVCCVFVYPKHVLQTITQAAKKSFQPLHMSPYVMPLYVCMHVCMGLSMGMHVLACMENIYDHVCIHANLYVYIYTYIYIYT